MSALAFQNVMALLIRFPTECLEVLLKKLDNPELTPKEQAQLQKMTEDPLVRKFGYKMRFSRQRDATKVMRLSKDIITIEVFDKVFRDLFEPSRTSTDLDTIGIQFIDFCLNDPQAKKQLADEVPYLTDVLKYEHTKALTELEMIKENDHRLLPGSYLRHSAFRILDLQYDVTSIDQLKVKDPSSHPIPKAKHLKLIFISIEKYPYCRIFQIDQSIEEFLLIQLSHPDQWLKALPKAYAGMAQVGLCRPLS